MMALKLNVRDNRHMTKLRMKRPEPLEKDIQSSILDYLQARNIFCWKEHSGGIMVDGGTRYMPIGLKGKADIIGLLRGGRFLAIEVKRPSGKVSEDQQFFLNMIKDMGGLAFVARNIDDVIKQIP